MAAHFSDIEKEIDDLCMKLILELRGSQAGNGNALINLELINQLQDKLSRIISIPTHKPRVRK
ncbi:hypothetical protein D3C81_1703790 [compost metagenome]